MKIVVAVKQVAALDDDFELREDGLGVDPDYLEWELNEWDGFALEAALQLREAAGDDGEIVVIALGAEEAEDGLLDCLAKGADRALRIWDDRMQDADVMQVARVLAAAVDREQPDLVLCGAQSSDAVNGATGVALAARLGLPRVAVVKRIDVEGERILVDRELEDGVIEVLSITTPALLTIQTGINEPRYASLRAIKQARAKPLEVVGLDELGLDTATIETSAGGRVRRMAVPSQNGGAEMLEGTAADMAARIAEIIHEVIPA